MGAEIKKLNILNLGQIRIILSLLAYAQCTLATIFDFELSQKKLFQVRLRSALECVKIVFLNFFNWLKLDFGKISM